MAYFWSMVSESVGIFDSFWVTPLPMVFEVVSLKLELPPDYSIDDLASRSWCVYGFWSSMVTAEFMG